MKVPRAIQVIAQTHSKFWDAMWDDGLRLHGQCVDNDDLGAYMAGGEL